MKKEKYILEPIKDKLNSVVLFFSTLVHNFKYYAIPSYREETRKLDLEETKNYDFEIELGILFSSVKNISYSRKKHYEIKQDLVSCLANYLEGSNPYNFKIKKFEDHWQKQKFFKIIFSYKSYNFTITYSRDYGCKLER